MKKAWKIFGSLVSLLLIINLITPPAGLFLTSVRAETSKTCADLGYADWRAAHKPGDEWNECLSNGKANHVKLDGKCQPTIERNIELDVCKPQKTNTQEERQPSSDCKGKEGQMISSFVRADCDSNLGKYVKIERWCNSQGQPFEKPGRVTTKACKKGDPPIVNLEELTNASTCKEGYCEEGGVCSEVGKKETSENGCTYICTEDGWKKEKCPSDSSKNGNRQIRLIVKVYKLPFYYYNEVTVPLQGAVVGVKGKVYRTDEKGIAYIDLEIPSLSVSYNPLGYWSSVPASRSIAIAVSKKGYKSTMTNVDISDKSKSDYVVNIKMSPKYENAQNENKKKEAQSKPASQPEENTNNNANVGSNGSQVNNSENELARVGAILRSLIPNEVTVTCNGGCSVKIKGGEDKTNEYQIRWDNTLVGNLLDVFNQPKTNVKVRFHYEKCLEFNSQGSCSLWGPGTTQTIPITIDQSVISEAATKVLRNKKLGELLGKAGVDVENLPQVIPTVSYNNGIFYFHYSNVDKDKLMFIDSITGHVNVELRVSYTDPSVKEKVFKKTVSAGQLLKPKGGHLRLTTPNINDWISNMVLKSTEYNIKDIEVKATFHSDVRWKWWEKGKPKTQTIPNEQTKRFHLDVSKYLPHEAQKAISVALAMGYLVSEEKRPTVTVAANGSGVHIETTEGRYRISLGGITREAVERALPEEAKKSNLVVNTITTFLQNNHKEIEKLVESSLRNNKVKVSGVAEIKVGQKSYSAQVQTDGLEITIKPFVADISLEDLNNLGSNGQATLSIRITGAGKVDLKGTLNQLGLPLLGNIISSVGWDLSYDFSQLSASEDINIDSAIDSALTGLDLQLEGSGNQSLRNSRWDVYADEGVNVPNARVEVRNEDGELVLTTKADKYGHVKLLLPVGGRYKIKISAPGFKTVETLYEPTAASVNYEAVLKLESGSGQKRVNLSPRLKSYIWNLDEGWNLVGLPSYSRPFSAKEVFELFNKDKINVDMMAYLKNNRWEIISLTNTKAQKMVLKTGHAYFLHAIGSVSKEIPIKNASQKKEKLELTANRWEAVTLPVNLGDSKEVLNEVKAKEVQVSRYQLGNEVWQSNVKMNDQFYGPNFPIKIGEGYLILVRN